MSRDRHAARPYARAGTGDRSIEMGARAAARARVIKYEGAARSRGRPGQGRTPLDLGVANIDPDRRPIFLRNRHMRTLILTAAAVALGACQPAAEPQPVDAQMAPDASATAPMDAAPMVAPEPIPAPPTTPAPAATPRPSTSRPARPAPAPAPTPPPADPMAGHDMSKMDGMTMPPKQ